MDPNRIAGGRAREAMRQRLQDMRIVEPWQNGRQRVLTVHPNPSPEWRARKAVRQQFSEMLVEPWQNGQQRVMDPNPNPDWTPAETLFQQLQEVQLLLGLPSETANLHQGEPDLNFPIASLSELMATDPLEEAMRYVVPLNAASVSHSSHNSAVSFAGLNHDTLCVGSLLSNPHPVNGRPVDEDFDSYVCIDVEALRLVHNAEIPVQPSIATSSKSSRDPLETVTVPSLSTRDQDDIDWVFTEVEELLSDEEAIIVDNDEITVSVATSER